MAGQGEPARITFDLDRDLHRRFHKVMPWGIRAHIFRVLTELFVEAMEKHGDVFLASILTGGIEFTVSEQDNQNLNGSNDD